MNSPESSPLVLLALESQSEGEEEAGKGNSTSLRTGKSVQLESSHSWNVFMEEELVGSILPVWLLLAELFQLRNSLKNLKDSSNTLLAALRSVD